MAKMYMSKSTLRMEDEMEKQIPIAPKMEMNNGIPPFVGGTTANFTENINNSIAPGGHQQPRNTMDQLAPQSKVLSKDEIKKLLNEN